MFHLHCKLGSFYGILVRKLKLIISQKEELHSEEAWAISEALNPHSLHEGGTFLNTLMRRIDDDLTSYLSYTVEYVDRWNNFNLYEDKNLQQFWLEVFFKDGICKLDYAAIKRRRNDEVAVVHQATADVGLLSASCKFPFSWLFLSAIQDQFATSGMWKCSELSSLSGSCEVMYYLIISYTVVHSFSACVEKMKTHYIGEFLYEYSPVEAAALELDKLYLKDFVAIVLQPASDKEAQVKLLCSYSSCSTYLQYGAQHICISYV